MSNNNIVQHQRERERERERGHFASCLMVIA
jgi:hypothetical protein